MVSFHGKVALILGSLHSVGAEMAELLVDAGAEVVLAEPNSLLGRTLAQQLGTAALYLSVDGIEEEHLHHLAAMTVDAFGRVDVLVIPLLAQSDEDRDASTKGFFDMSMITIRPTHEVMQEPQIETHYLPDDLSLLLHADPSRRIAVTFMSDGLRLAGHLYRPPTVSRGQETAGVVMCGPISSVKEQTLPHYAERLSEAGYTVLTFDSRNYGESEGIPRHHYDPNQIIADYSNAVSYLLSREDIDHERVSVVGVCMGGGYAVSTAAMDKRIKAVASVAGGYNIGGTFQQMMGVEGFVKSQAQINALHAKQIILGKVEYIPTIAHHLSTEIPMAVMPNEEAYSYYDRTSKADAPNWLPNTMTAASLEPYYIYNAVAHAPLVAPTPLLLIHGTTDFFLLPEYAQQVYDAAIGPKELVWIETHNHIELYDQDPYVSQAVQALLSWLAIHGK